MDLVSHFEGLLGRIEPSSGHVAKAKAAHEKLRERLRKDEEVGKAHIDTYLSGSYARHTAILDIKDVDVICVLNIDKDETKPIVLLRWVESRLLGYYTNVVVQGRSIGVTTDDGIDLDVVPGSPVGSENGPLWIPDREAGRWIDSHPKGQLAFERQRNTETGSHYVQVVKLLKHWRSRLAAPAAETKSYVLEALVAHTMGSIPPQSHGQAVVKVLEGILSRYGSLASSGIVPNIPDPGYPSKSVSKRWKASEFISFMGEVRTAAGIARRAWEAMEESSSRALWRKIFGNEFSSAD